jgi:ABC-type multidrug transport system ATPase subunit
VAPILQVQGLTKTYRRGFLRRQPTFSLRADFSVSHPQIIGVMGPNGSGKTTLFELLSGSALPSAGKVICAGQDVHRVKYRERDRLVIHYHQSYQVRRVHKTVPGWMLNGATSPYPLVHIFDEPQFSMQDGYIGFMLGFFEQLRSNGRAVFLCLHPNEPFQIEIMRNCCQRYLFVSNGQVAEASTYQNLLTYPGVREYLGNLADL